MERRGMPAKASGPNVPDLTPPNRDRTMELVLTAIRKKHGAESVMRLNQEIVDLKHEVLPSGSLLLDRALGVGGWPLGRIVEVYGPEQTGKTTMTLQAVAEAQRRGGIAGFIDVEHALDLGYASGIGVNVPDLLFSQPDNGEQALQIAEEMILGGVSAIVIDSVAALTPKAEIEGEIGDQHMGLQARLMSQAMRKLNGTVAKHRCVLFFINQLRMKIGVVFGNPETTTGGNALKFYASVRLDVRGGTRLKKGEVVVGHQVNLKVVKNKLAPPHRKVTAELVYGRGLWRAAEILDLAVEYGLIERSGAWYSRGGERLAQGRENAAAAIECQPEVLKELEDNVRAKIFAG